MGRLSKLSYLDDSERIAVAICHSGNHVGILYRDEDNPTKVILFHLCWNHDLRNSTPRIDDGCGMWLTPVLEPEVINRIIANLINIWERNRHGEMPYGFGGPRGFFDSEGNIVPGKIGLSCASIVLAVFDLSGAPLVQYDTWNQRSDAERDEDATKIMQFAQTLRAQAKNDSEREQANLIESQKGALRFRPLQVAAAADSRYRPINYRKAVALAAQIKSLIDQAKNSQSIVYGHCP